MYRLFIHHLLQMVENSVKRGLATSPFARRKRSVMEDLYVRLRCCMFDYMHRSKRFEFGYSHSVSALTRMFLSILYLSVSPSPLASRPPTVSVYLSVSLYLPHRYSPFSEHPKESRMVRSVVRILASDVQHGAVVLPLSADMGACR